MITKEERDSIINEAVEKALLVLPEVIGNLIANHTAYIKLNRDFYKKYPEFASRKDVVQSVVEKVEGDNFGMEYKDILTKAIPLIRKRLNLVDSLDMKTVHRPNRDLSKLDLTDHGEL